MQEQYTFVLEMYNFFCDYEDAILYKWKPQGSLGQKFKKSFNGEIYLKYWGRVMVFNASLNSISATYVYHGGKFYHIMLYQVHFTMLKY
jgi:hypothetical protein